MDGVEARGGDDDVVVRLELVEADEDGGWWCFDCAMPSGVRLTFATETFAHDGSLVLLRTIYRCHECGGAEVGC